MENQAAGAAAIGSHTETRAQQFSAIARVDSFSGQFGGNRLEGISTQSAPYPDQAAPADADKRGRFAKIPTWGRLDDS